MIESKAAFARRKSWNRSTVTRYADAGKIVVTEKGLVDVEASEERLAKAADPDKEGVRQRHDRERRGKGGESTRLDPNDTGYQLLTKHRAEAEAARAQLLNLELAEEQGRLVDVEIVRRREFQLARAGREAIMNLEHRLDPLLAGESDPAKRRELWDREKRAICEELARATAASLEAAPAEK